MIIDVTYHTHGAGIGWSNTPVVGLRHRVGTLTVRGGTLLPATTVCGHARAESGVLGFAFRVTQTIVEIGEEEVVQPELLALWLSLQGQVGELDRLRVALLSLQKGQCEHQEWAWRLGVRLNRVAQYPLLLVRPTETSFEATQRERRWEVVR